MISGPLLPRSGFATQGLGTVKGLRVSWDNNQSLSTLIGLRVLLAFVFKHLVLYEQPSFQLVYSPISLHVQP
jgi:hypothetical protein